MTKIYLVLLIDKKHTKFFILRGESIERILEKHVREYVPQIVKHGDDTWDATDKIFRHIQVHLDRYLKSAMKEVMSFIGKEDIDGIFIGSHKMLFSVIQKHLPRVLQQKVKGYIVVDLKIPFNLQVEKIKKTIASLDKSYNII